MSRLGKRPLIIMDGVEIKKEGGTINIKGPKGELSRDFRDSVAIEIDKDKKEISLTPKKEDHLSIALWGTYASHLKNMMLGVTAGFSKTLIIEGVGFRAMVEGANLVLSLGFSHPVKMAIPEGIQITVEKNKIHISGYDKEKVGQVSATIRAYKKPEPYKGKGIRYENEIIRRKAGKKAVGSG